jgi:ribosome maturation factor RimP
VGDSSTTTQERGGLTVTGHPPEEALVAALTGPLAAGGVDLEGVEVSTAGRRRLVRVLVDKETGITLDDVADATHVVSGVLDDGDLLGEAPYTLEVTSPGTDRPLTMPRHWRRNVDRLVKVHPQAGQPYVGRVRSADDDAAVLDVDGTLRTVPFAEVAKAKVEIEFNRPKASQPAPKAMDDKE